MDMKSQIETVIKSKASESSEEIEDRLIELVKSFLAEGISKEVLIDELSQMHLNLMATGRDSDDDIILNILDYLEGWCSPHMKL